MSWTAVLLAVVVVGGTGIFIGLFLGFAGRKFAVEVDEKEAAVLDALPGNNCGGCGFPGCSGLAAAIVAGEGCGAAFALLLLFLTLKRTTAPSFDSETA